MKKNLLIAVVGLALALPATAGAGQYDVLYRVCAGSLTDGKSILSRVDIDEGAGRANVTTIDVLDGYELIDVMGVSPDGKTAYLVNDAWFTIPNNFHLLVYNLQNNTFVDKGPVSFSDGTPPRIDQMAVATDGTIYTSNFNSGALYRLDPTTAVATLVGTAVNQDNNAPLTVIGGDLVFTASGECLFWTNAGSAAAPAGLWRLNLPAVNGEVLAEYLGTGNDGDHWFTGLALTGNGNGVVVGSNRVDEIHAQSPIDGSDIAVYPTFIGDSNTPYIGHNYGDMSSGPLLDGCTYTRGYWRNHSWPTTVSLCGGSYVIDEQLGRRHILRRANNRDHSQLVAQLVAAKLNCNDCVGIADLDAAEDYLCNDAQIVGDGDNWWHIGFDDGDQKDYATALKTALDTYNNSNHCD